MHSLSNFITPFLYLTPPRFCIDHIDFGSTLLRFIRLNDSSRDINPWATCLDTPDPYAVGPILQHIHITSDVDCTRVVITTLIYCS